jgi:hypothetical protein
MRHPHKRNAALAGTRNGVQNPGASEGNQLKALYPTVGFPQWTSPLPPLLAAGIFRPQRLALWSSLLA